MKESNYNYKIHWDNAYKNISSKNLGWFESDPKLSIELIEKCGLKKNSVIQKDLESRVQYSNNGKLKIASQQHNNNNNNYFFF